MQRRRVRWPALVSALAAQALGLAASRAGAQPPVPVGVEFQANTYTLNEQSRPDVALTPDGDFVVVFEDNLSEGATDLSEISIAGQRYASDGSPQGTQFQVNTYTTQRQWFPSVASDASGGFVVVWRSDGSFGTDASGGSVQGQRYASDGSAQGGEFQINTYTTGFQFQPSVAADADGDFVVVWSNPGIKGQRYSSDGSTSGGEFQVNTSGGGGDAVVAMDPEGDFVVVWTGIGPDIRGQRYASSGAALGANFVVNSYTTGAQYYPDVAVDADGDFVVVWESPGSPGTDTGDRSIQARRFASSGSAQGAQFQVNTYTTGEQLRPAAAVAAGGEFLVLWHGIGSFFFDSSGDSVQGQLYASDGSPRGGQFQVNTYTTDGQDDPSAAADAEGNFAVVWRSVGSTGTDASNTSIQGQRYSLPPTAPPVPAMSRALSFALVTALLLGAAWTLRRRT